MHPVERPIRSFEVLADIRASWNTEKTVNSLLLKRTALSSRLSVEVRGGFVPPTVSSKGANCVFWGV